MPPTGDDVVVSDELVLPAAELVWRFTPSGGPGGQHANTSNTRAEVSFDIASSGVLSERQRELLAARFGRRLAVGADDTRSQSRNRDLATQRLADRLRSALRTTPERRPKRPSRAARERRLRAKRHRSRLKADRRRPPAD